MAQRLPNGTLVLAEIRSKDQTGQGLGIVTGYSDRTYNVELSVPHDVKWKNFYRDNDPYKLLELCCFRRELTALTQEEFDAKLKELRAKHKKVLLKEITIKDNLNFYDALAKLVPITKKRSNTRGQVAHY